MTFDKVDRTLVAGVASLLSLYHMLGEAVERACVASSTAPSNGEGYMGYSLDKTKFWCGYSYSRPEEILFQLNSGTFDGETAQSEGFQKSATGLWTRSLKLNECHFFDEVKREKQAKLLFDFLKDAYERGKRCCVQ